MQYVCVVVYSVLILCLLMQLMLKASVGFIPVRRDYHPPNFGVSMKVFLTLIMRNVILLS